MKQNISKSILSMIMLGSITTFGLTACGSDNPPYVLKLERNVKAITPHDNLQVFAMDNYKAIMSGQQARFKVIYDLREDGENRVLIPSNTIISGTYFNDGTNCHVKWKDVYAHGDENVEHRNAVDISHIATPTTCDPAVGFKYGEPIIIQFNKIR